MKQSPNFHTWSHRNLTNFATEAYAKLIEQNEQLEQLRLKILALGNHDAHSFTLPIGVYPDERFFIRGVDGKVIYMFGWTGEFWADKDTVFSIDAEVSDGNK